MSRSAVTAVDFLPFSKLTQANLAPRVRSLLEGTYQTAWPLIDAGVEKALDELDLELFKQADKAGNVNDQNKNFEGLREFRRRRADFVGAFRDLVQRGMLALVDEKLHDEAPPPLRPRAQAISELSLIDPVELEQELALGEIAARADIRANAPLHALAYRFGVIAGSGPLEHEALPLGPHKLCNALRVAARKFDVIVAHRVLLFRQLDRALFSDPIPFYEALNRYLIEHRVFAHLHLAPRKVPTAGAASAAPAPAPAPAADAPAPAEVAEAPVPAAAPPAPVAPPLTPFNDPRGALPAAPDAPLSRAPAELPLDFRNSPAAQAFQQVVSAAANEQARAQTAMSSGETAMDTQFFATLRELLAGRRGPAPAEADQARPLADTRDVQSILTVLQSQPTAPVMVGGKWVNRGVSHIKQDMMNQLRSLSDGATPRLREEDSDTIDLVGFLFDHLLADYRPNSLSHGLMSRLQVPLLKVALKDKSFFTRRNHPARQLLNTIAETSSYWIEDEDQDRPVIEKMRVVVDRVIKEFDDDVTVFDRLFDDLSKHMGGLQKKAEVAERRHVEAAKGREKLDLARAAAQEAVQQRMFEREPPAVLKALLESTWTDAIALSLLRQGIDSPTTRERLGIVDQLIGLFAPGRTLTERQHALDDLRGPLEDGLGAVGFHEDAISKACDDIARLIEQQASDHPETPVASPAIEQLVKQNPRLGGDSRPSANVSEPEAAAVPVAAGAAAPSTILQNLRKVEALPLGPKERDMIERVKQLPFGTWFEFVLNQQGDKARRKLCWFSPVTGRCLFVNPRGGKAEERMIDQLARDLLRGNAHVVEESHEKLIDRAWKGIVNALKGVGIGSKAAVAAAAT